MRRPVPAGWWAGLCLLLLAWPATAAETVYVTDRIVAGIYPTPDTRGQPLVSVPTGTPLEVLVRAGGYVRVRTGEGVEGWTKERLVTEQRPAQASLYKLSADYRAAQAELRQARETIEALRRREQELARVPAWWLWVVTGGGLIIGFMGGALWLDYRHRTRHGGFRV